MAPVRADPVLAAVERQWFAWAARENLIARWVKKRSIGGRIYVQRQKDDGRGAVERTSQVNGAWMLLNNKDINGKSIPILTVEIMAENVYDEYLAARTSKETVDVFCRRFGRTYEGTRHEDIRKIIQWIKNAEKDLGGPYQGRRNQPEPIIIDSPTATPSPRKRPSLGCVVTPRRVTSAQTNTPSTSRTVPIDSLTLDTPISRRAPTNSRNVSSSSKTSTQFIKHPSTNHKLSNPYSKAADTDKTPPKGYAGFEEPSIGAGNLSGDDVFGGVHVSKKVRPLGSAFHGSLAVRMSPVSGPADRDWASLPRTASGLNSVSGFEVSDTHVKGPGAYAPARTGNRNVFGLGGRPNGFEAIKTGPRASTISPTVSEGRNVSGTLASNGMFGVGAKRLPSGPGEVSPTKLRNTSNNRNFTGPSGMSNAPGFGGTQGIEKERVYSRPGEVSTPALRNPSNNRNFTGPAGKPSFDFGKPLTPATSTASTFAVAPPSGPSGRSNFQSGNQSAPAPAPTLAVAPPTGPRGKASFQFGRPSAPPPAPTSTFAVAPPTGPRADRWPEPSHEEDDCYRPNYPPGYDPRRDPCYWDE